VFAAGMAVFFANLMFAFVRKAPAPANPWGQGDHAQMETASATCPCEKTT
jgi:hypothetical protein